MITAVAYLRMSDKKQDKSIDQQRAEIVRYAGSHGYRIVRWYEDHGISGGESERRAGFQSLIADVQSGSGSAFSAVLVWNQDRFSRFDPMEANYYWFILRRAGVQIVSVSQGVLDFETLGGWLKVSVEQHGKAQYLRDLSQNVTRGMMERAQKGEWPGGPAPLGYVIGSDKRLSLGSPHNIATVRMIFDGYLGGHSLRSLAELLAAKGCRTARGRPFEYVAIRFILKNPNYTGDLHWNLRSDSKYGSVRRGQWDKPIDGRFHDEDDWLIVRGCHPAIVSHGEYEAVQARLAAQKLASTPVKAGGRFVLSGLLRCGKCGSSMTGNTYSGLAYYVCCGYFHRGASFCLRNAVRQDELVGRVIDTIDDRLLSPATIAKVRERIERQLRSDRSKATMAAAESRLAEAQQELAVAERNMALASNEFLRRRYEKIVTELAEREELLKASLDAAAGGGRNTATQARDRLEAALAQLKSLRTTLEAADTMRLRELLHRTIERVRVFVRHEQREKRRRFFLAGGEIEIRALNLFGTDRRSTQVLRWGKTG